MDQKFWENENFGRSLGRASKCWNQPAWVDHISPKRWAGRSLGRANKCWNQPAWVDRISPKRWAVRRRRFEKSPLRVSTLVFLTLPPHLVGWNLPFLMELRDFNFLKIGLLLEYGRTFISTVWIFVYCKSEFFGLDHIFNSYLYFSRLVSIKSFYETTCFLQKVVVLS
jgi:hypothetical protein